MKLNRRQKAFADFYLECGNATEAARKAGYKEESCRTIGCQNLTKRNISDYIDERMQAQNEARVASADEVLQFFSSVMRGEVKDQFGLDAALSDRLNAGKELMKRYAAADNSARSDVPQIIDRRPEG